MPAKKSETGIRSGRFRVETINASFDFLHGCAGNVYRIFNAGKKAIKLTSGPTATAVLVGSIEPQCSLDYCVPNTSPISVKTVAAATVPVEGIYDLLSDEATIRSGRFKFKDAAVTTRTIVDLNNRQAGISSTYRIFNSGEKRIIVDWTNSVAPSNLDPEQSLDIVLTGLATITVTAAAGDPINGIYETLN